MSTTFGRVEGPHKSVDQSAYPHAVARAAIAAFMHRTGISVAGVECDSEGTLERRVREIVKTWDIGDASLIQIDPHIITGVRCAATAYAHTPFDVQVHIAVYTMLLSAIDDFDIGSAAMEEFMTRLHTGAPQRHPLLQHFVDNLADMEKFFPPFASKAIVTSTISFINQTTIDKETKHMPLNEAAVPYIEYKRIYNGASEAYGFLIWDRHTFPDITSHIQIIPENMIYVNYVNDIFSFYKEELAGETGNYIHDRAHVTKKTVSEAIFDVVDDAVAAVERMRIIIQGGEEKVVLERFLAGYILFHFLSPRYKLRELTGTQYL